jgi:hypothetical protein
MPYTLLRDTTRMPIMNYNPAIALPGLQEDAAEQLDALLQ